MNTDVFAGESEDLKFPAMKDRQVIIVGFLHLQMCN